MNLGAAKLHNFHKHLRRTMVLLPSAMLAVIFALYILMFSGSVTWNVLMIALILGVLGGYFSEIIFGFFFIATIFIPNDMLPLLSASDGFFGYDSFGFLRLHPAVIVIFTGSFLRVVLNYHKLVEALRMHKILRVVVVGLALFTLSMFLQTSYFRGFKGLPQCFQNYVFPFVFFLFMLTEDREKILKALKLYVVFISAVGLYGIIEYLFETNFLYDKIYMFASPHWYLYISEGNYRITTTIGHPLVNGVYYLFSIPIVYYIFQRPLNVILIIVLFGATMATGSRVAFVLALVSILFCSFSFNVSVFKRIKVIVIGVVTFGMTYTAIFKTHLGTTLMRRFVEEEGSALMRLKSLAYMPDRIKSNFVFGNGMGFSFESSASYFGFSTGYENPWLMLIIDTGFVTALLYAVTILVFMLWKINYLKCSDIFKGIYISFIAVLVMLTSFNSFGGRNTINLLLWFVIGLLFCKKAGTVENTTSQ